MKIFLNCWILMMTLNEFKTLTKKYNLVLNMSEEIRTTYYPFDYVAFASLPDEVYNNKKILCLRILKIGLVGVVYDGSGKYYNDLIQFEQSLVKEILHRKKLKMKTKFKQIEKDFL